MSKPDPKDVIKVVASNRKASHDFHIHERYEAGVVLVGSEVKSLREAKVTLTDGFATLQKGELWMEGMTINEYGWANRFNHDIKRKRKLLLHRQEIGKIATKITMRGFTLIPLSIYFKGGRVKIELGLVTHKKEWDKRASKMEADAKREIDRATRAHR